MGEEDVDDTYLVDIGNGKLGQLHPHHVLQVVHRASHNLSDVVDLQALVVPDGGHFAQPIRVKVIGSQQVQHLK